MSRAYLKSAHKMAAFLVVASVTCTAEADPASAPVDMTKFLRSLDAPEPTGSTSLAPVTSPKVRAKKTAHRKTVKPLSENGPTEATAPPLPAEMIQMIPEETTNPVKDNQEQAGPSAEKIFQDKEEIQEPAIAKKDPMSEPEMSTKPEQAPSKGYVEAGGGRQILTGSEPAWSDAYLRGSWVQSEKNVWNYEMVSARRFGDKGIFLSGGLTRNFTEDWYGSMAIGTSTDGFFWPRHRVDAFLHHKLLDKKNLVATVGYTNYQAKDSHRDRILHLGADYYFESPWLLSGELIVNNSSPGNVNANYAFLAATYGHEKTYLLTLHVGNGKEAYQLLNNTQVISGFYSSVATMTYRKWIGRDWGLNLVGEYYFNPQYKRRGIELGIFKDL